MFRNLLSIFRSRSGRPRKLYVNILAGFVLVLLGTGYIYLLKVADANAVAELAELRANDTPEYLETVRHQKGFKTYVAKLNKVRHYDRPKSTVPPFLLGRWALFDKPQRVSAQFIAEDCAESLAIEDGAFKRLGSVRAEYPARYRIDGDTVKAHLANGKVMPIKLVSYGMDLHHIVATLPGNADPSYGYLCK